VVRVTAINGFKLNCEFAGDLAGEKNLPILNGLGTKRTGAGEEIILPHAMEAFAISKPELVPVGLELFMPCHEGPVVEFRPVLQFFHHKESIDRFPDLRNGGQHGTWENIPVGPRIQTMASFVGADGVQEEETSRFQAAARDVHVFPVIFVTNVLEHSERDNVVELLI
jgi:hypothetical protein